MGNALGVIDASDCRAIMGRHGAVAMAARRIDGKPLVEWVARRVSEAQRLAEVVVSLPRTDESSRIRSILPPDISVVIGHESDALSRLARVAEQCTYPGIVRISLDTPFVDPVFIDRLVSTSEQYPECDYIGYCCNNGRPAMLSRIGLFAEWYRSSNLARAVRKGSPPGNVAGLTRFVFAHPELFQMRLLPAPERLDRHDMRLTLESQEDWEHVEQIHDALGPENLDWQGIAELLRQHPHLTRRMATLNEANTEASV